MNRSILKPDIDVLFCLLAETAAIRAEIIKETWNYPQKHRLSCTEAWQRTIQDLVTSQRNRLYASLFSMLTSDVMKMKYPDIVEIEQMDVSEIKKITIILIIIGLPAETIADLIILNTGYVYAVLMENAKIFK